MRTVAALLLLLVLAAIGGCGLKTDPQPPKEGCRPVLELTAIS